MSTDYDASLFVGWMFTEDDLKKVFGQKVLEESHEEDRWDPNTGKPVGRVKVVDRPEGIYLRLPDDGRMFESSIWQETDDGNVTEFLDALCERLKCHYNWPNLDNDCFCLGFCPRYAEGTREGELVRLFKKCRTLAPKLQKLGLKGAGKLQVRTYALLNVS